MSGTVRVSVVMGARGGAGLLAESLDSVLDQQGVSFELLLVVDGTLDGSAEVELAARTAAHGERLRVLRRPTEGLTRALIAGCAAAQGAYIARIDAGDRMHPGRLARQAALLDAYPDCVLTACATQMCGPDWEPLWVNSGAPASDTPISLLGPDPEAGLAGDIPHHGSTMFRRAAYLTAGGYRPEFYYGQDWDLWYRLAERGTYGLLPEVLYSVRLFPDGISMRRWRQQRRIAECSRGAFVARRRGDDEAAWLAQARAIRPDPEAGRETSWFHALWSAGDGSYFIGEALRRNGDPRALGYLWAAQRAAPLNPRPWVRLAQARLSPPPPPSTSEPPINPNRPLLVVVQDCETQFDAPFYAYLAGRDGLALHVYYTQTRARSAGPVDPEIGQAPRWDHLSGVDYPHTHRPTRTLPEALALARAIAALRPTHVILSGYSPPSHLMLALLLRRAGLSIGLRSDNTLEHSSFRGPKGLLKRLVLPDILRLYTAWHPVGSAAEAYLRRIAGVARPVFRFPYAADNDWFAHESAPWRQGRGEWRVTRGWEADAFVVLGVLKWHPREDPLTLVCGFIALRRAVPMARLVLVGDGPLRREIEQALAGHSEAVHMPGYVAYGDLPRWYGRADVFVHPARSEPWGVSVNEAMACGLPVVVSEGVGARGDLVVEGETGATFAVGDADALAARLIELARDRGHGAAMGHAARARVARWGYAQSRQAMLDALAHVAGTRPNEGARP